MSGIDTTVDDELEPLKENEEGEDKVKKTSYAWVWGIVIFILIFLLIALIVYLIWRSRKSKCPDDPTKTDESGSAPPKKSMQVDESWCGSRRPKSPSGAMRSASRLD